MDNIKKRRVYDAAVKRKIILYAEEHGNRAAGRAFEIPESCIRLWRKHQEEIFNSTGKSKIVITGSFRTWSDQIEDALREYINELKKNGSPVPLEIVQLRAHDLAMSLNIPLAQFEATRTWIKRFIKRKPFFVHYKLSTVNKMSEEYEKKLLKYQQFIVHLRKQNMYPLCQIGNANEIPVFLDLPSASNKGFTVMLCVTADGGKLPPYIIFKCENVLKKNFPGDVIVQTQENGCMTTELMLDWYKTVWCSRPGAELNPRAMLTLDSSMSHLLTEDWLTGGNTDLVVVPNNTASLPQPVNIYINKAFKERFRCQCEKWLLSKGRLKSASPSLLSYWISAAWNEISVEAIVKSFKKCHLSSALDGTEDGFLPISEDEYIVSSNEFKATSASELKSLSEDDVTVLDDSDSETPTSSCRGVQSSVSEQNEQLIPLAFSVIDSGVEELAWNSDTKIASLVLALFVMTLCVSWKKFACAWNIKTVCERDSSVFNVQLHDTTDPLDIGSENENIIVSDILDADTVRDEVKNEIKMEKQGEAHTAADEVSRVEETIGCEDISADDREAASSTQDDEVMVVLHGAGLMFLRSALQAPVTRPQ